MGKASGGAFILAGIFLVFLGILISSDILSKLLDVLGFVVFVMGVIVGVVGLIRVFSGGGSTSSDY